MQNVLSPMVTMYHTQLETSRRFADAIFMGTEKIDRAIIGATHRAFLAQLRFAESLPMIRDPRSAGATLQSNLLGRDPNEAMNYQKEIMRVFAEMQNEIGRSMQDYLKQVGSHAVSTAAAPLEVAQERVNDAMFNPMTSMFSVWESAFKEVAALARRNMAAAQSTAEDATRKVAENVDTYTAMAADSAIASSSAAVKSAAAVVEQGGAVEEKAGSSSIATNSPPPSTPATGGGGGKRK